MEKHHSKNKWYLLLTISSLFLLTACGTSEPQSDTDITATQESEYPDQSSGDEDEVNNTDNNEEAQETASAEQTEPSKEHTYKVIDKRAEEPDYIEISKENIKEIMISQSPDKINRSRRYAHITDPSMISEIIETINGWELKKQEEFTGGEGCPGGIVFYYQDLRNDVNWVFREDGFETGWNSYKNSDADFSLDYFWTFFDKPNVEVYYPNREQK